MTSLGQLYTAKSVVPDYSNVIILYSSGQIFCITKSGFQGNIWKKNVHLSLAAGCPGINPVVFIKFLA